MLGMPIAGLLWSLATLFAKADVVSSLSVTPSEAFFAIALGGMALTFAMWVGFAAVGWARIRAFGGSVPILVMTTLTSRAAPPLWIGAPAAAYWLNDPSQNGLILAIITLASLALFLQARANLLADALVSSRARAAAGIVSAAVFMGSFAYLSI